MKNSIQHFSKDGIKNLEKAEENLAMYPDYLAALPGLFLRVMCGVISFVLAGHICMYLENK